jgi:hypothetical protein
MVGKGEPKKLRGRPLPSQNILGLALCLFHESVFGVFHVTPAAIRFSNDSAVFVIDSDKSCQSSRHKLEHSVLQGQSAVPAALVEKKALSRAQQTWK